MKKSFILVFLLIFLSVILPGCATATYNGKIAVIGSDPHTFVSLVDEEGRVFKITGEFEKKLRKEYQNQQVVLKGSVIAEAKGPGFPAVLKVIKIVEP
jgi:hypothetical protein